MSRTHGTRSCYNDGCRCAECRRVNAVYQERRRRTVHLDSNDPRHGTDNGYTNHGCRCTDCRTAHATIARAASDRQRKADAAGRTP